MDEIKDNELKLENDLLDRRLYAANLIRIIFEYIKENENESDSKSNEKLNGTPTPNAIKKKTNTDNQSFIIAISGAWGSGKTTFVKMLIDVLTKEEMPEQDNNTNEFTKSHKIDEDDVAYFDAWKNDFDARPIIQFAQFVTSVCTKDKHVDAKQTDAEQADAEQTDAEQTDAEQTDAEQTDAEQTDAEQNFNSLLSGLYSHIYGDGVKSSDTKKIDDKKTDMPIIQLMEQIQNDLKKYIEEPKHRTIVIVIDELDRCKPTFAIDLLEIVKHLFNVKGIVFIFALDMHQLQHSVKRVYGIDFDAIGYLERFFDYTTLLPQGNIRSLFFKTLQEFDISYDATLGNVFYNICRSFNLSIREIRAVCSAFNYLNKFELKDYPNHSKQLYFYLLVLKYKKPAEVTEALSEKAKSKEIRKELISEFPPLFDPSRPTDTGINNTVYFTDLFIKNPVIGRYSEYHWIGENGFADPDSRDFEKKIPTGSFSYALYIPDLAHGNEIKGMHILEYLFRKVELYGSAL